MTSSASQSPARSSFYSGLLLGNTWGLWLQSGPGSVAYNIYLTAEKMGNQTSRNASPITQELVDELCQLVQQSYSAPYKLSFNPFGLEPARVQPPIASDFAISSMVDEGDETQPLSNPNAAVGQPIAFVDSPSKTYTQLRVLQKNQSQPKLRKKAKKISKAPKPNIRKSQPAQSPEDGDCNSNETVAVDDFMRDQNNCKSYHKLVKNYLIQRGLGQEIDKYETKYHTRYYFIVCLIMIKHHLKENFTDIYQTIVEKELSIQQRKIDRKLSELSLTRDRLTTSQSKGQPTQMLRTKQANLQSQIEHIKVVKFEIENYSMRSCRAFFQGEIEESLKILYLKNDPVMRKKYYFDQALLVVKELQSQMRKSHSHR